MSETPAAGLYVHVPFCSAVCPYCDFAVQIGNTPLRARFVDALCTEIEDRAGWRHPIDTVYFGGGTPSLLTDQQLERILDAAADHLPIAPDAAVYFEANPEDVTPSRLAGWKSNGVQFLSLGVQSFDDRELKRLGRRHSGAQAHKAVRRALDAGFDTVSVDLMFGLPGQGLADWKASLQTMVDLRPQHVSCYQLTVHEGTTFHRWRERGKLIELGEENQAVLFDFTHERLSDSGYAAYEVSNFALGPAHRSAHNQKYWSHVPYLGLGPSAHSFDGSRRWWNHSGLNAYLERVDRGERPVAETEVLSQEDLALEALMLGLRTTDGIALDDFSSRYGIDLATQNARLLSSLVSEGLAHDDARALRLTSSGFAVADGLAARFVL